MDQNTTHAKKFGAGGGLIGNADGATAFADPAHVPGSTKTGVQFANEIADALNNIAESAKDHCTADAMGGGKRRGRKAACKNSKKKSSCGRRKKCSWAKSHKRKGSRKRVSGSCKKKSRRKSKRR